jgi:peptide/nickel transport system substrate-binding protein
MFDSVDPCVVEADHLDPMLRPMALTGAIAAALLAVSGAGGAGAQTPTRGGIVSFGPTAEPACLSPLGGACFNQTVSFWIFETVVAPAYRLTPKMTALPALVSHVSVTSSPRPTLTYHIRSKARWSDGVDVSAQDFLFTHRAILGHLASDPGSGKAHRLVRSIRVVDTKTLRIVLRLGDADWRRLLFPFVLPRHALAGEDLTRVWTDRIHDPRTGRPIGSGPFLVEEWKRGEQLTLVRNPRYWGPHVARLDRIVVRFCQRDCSGSEVRETFGQGEVDLTLTRDMSVVPSLRRVPGSDIVLGGSPAGDHLDLRIRGKGHPALRSRLVRQAILYGIDRVAIVRQLFGAIDLSLQPSHSAAFLDSSSYYRPNWRRYGYRPARSRSLLQRAGCRRGADRVYVCGDERLSLRFFTTVTSNNRVRAIELIQAQLRRVGIEVRPKFATPAAFFGQIVPSGDFDAALQAWVVFSTSIAARATFGCGGEENPTGYCRTGVTRELGQADRTLDARERARILNRIDRQLAEDVPVIPLYQAPYALAHMKSVRNVVPAPSNPFWNAENWWLER